MCTLTMTIVHWVAFVLLVFVVLFNMILLVVINCIVVKFVDELLLLLLLLVIVVVVFLLQQRQLLCFKVDFIAIVIFAAITSTATFIFTKIHAIFTIVHIFIVVILVITICVVIFETTNRVQVNLTNIFILFRSTRHTPNKGAQLLTQFFLHWYAIRQV